MRLGQKGDFPRQGFTRKGTDVAAEKVDSTAGNRNHAVYGFEEGTLAAAIGADDGRDLALWKGRRHIVKDGLAAPLDDEMFDGNGIHGLHFLSQEK